MLHKLSKYHKEIVLVLLIVFIVMVLLHLSVGGLESALMFVGGVWAASAFALIISLLTSRAPKCAADVPEQMMTTPVTALPPTSQPTMSFAPNPNDIVQLYEPQKSLSVDEAMARKWEHSGKLSKQAANFRSASQIKYAQNMFEEELTSNASRSWWDNNSLDLQMHHVI